MKRIYRYGNTVIDWENQWIYHLSGDEQPVIQEYKYIREVKEAIYLDNSRFPYESRMKMSKLMIALEQEEYFRHFHGFESEKVFLRQKKAQVESDLKKVGELSHDMYREIISKLEKNDEYWISYVGGEPKEIAEERYKLFLEYGLRLEGFYPETAQWAIKAYRWLASNEKILEGLKRFGPIIQPVNGYRLVECPNDGWEKRYIGSKDGFTWYVLTSSRLTDDLIIESGPFDVYSPDDSKKILAAVQLEEPGSNKEASE